MILNQAFRWDVQQGSRRIFLVLRTWYPFTVSDERMADHRIVINAGTFLSWQKTQVKR